MSDLRIPDLIYDRTGDSVVFNQLAVKVELDSVPTEEYFAWLDRRQCRHRNAVSDPGNGMAWL